MQNSLPRNRTSSLLSVTASAYTASNTSANGEDRTTPTPTNDGGLSSPPVTSPATSSVGSPQPTSLALQAAPGKPLSLQAQRALDGLTVDTPLRQSLSFTRHAPMRKVKVPMPSKKATSYGRSSDAGSRHSQSQSESGDVVAKSPKSEIQGHQRAASGPYAFGRDRASSKRILDRRRAEVPDLETQSSENAVMDEVDLHVEPIPKGKGDANQPDAVMQGENASASARSKLAPAKTTVNRLTPSIDSTSNSGTSSRTVGRSQLRVGREKTNHHQSASVSTASQAPPPSSTTTGRASSLAPSGLEDRTRIPSSEIPSRFNPKTNDRLNRATSTGRFSLPPPDDDDEDVGMASGSRGARRGHSQGREVQRPPTGPTLITERLNGGNRDKTPERESASEVSHFVGTFSFNTDFSSAAHEYQPH